MENFFSVFPSNYVVKVKTIFFTFPFSLSSLSFLSETLFSYREREVLTNKFFYMHVFPIKILHGAAKRFQYFYSTWNDFYIFIQPKQPAIPVPTTFLSLSLSLLFMIIFSPCHTALYSARRE